jgi:hypothetical protein
MLQPLGEENNFDLYNAGRLPYLRFDLAQETYALGMSQSLHLSHSTCRHFYVLILQEAEIYARL